MEDVTVQYFYANKQPQLDYFYVSETNATIAFVVMLPQHTDVSDVVTNTVAEMLQHVSKHQLMVQKGVLEPGCGQTRRKLPTRCTENSLIFSWFSQYSNLYDDTNNIDKS